MKRLLIAVVFLSACSFVYGSSLRITSMGNAMIGLRDLERDPVMLNPSRASFLDSSISISELSYSKYSYVSYGKDEFSKKPPYAGWVNYRSNSNVTYDTYNINNLTYFKLSDSMVFGIKNAVGLNKDYSRSESIVSGKWITNTVFLSSNTRINQSENISEENNLASQILAGVNLGAVSLGLQYSKGFPSSYKTKSRSIFVDNELYSVTYDYQNTFQAVEYNTYSDSYKGGITWDVSKDVSIDLIHTISASGSWQRTMEKALNGVNQWADDKGEFPITKAESTSVTDEALFNYMPSDDTTYGLYALNYKGSQDNSVENGTAAYNAAKADTSRINLGAGLAFEPDEAMTFALDILFAGNNSYTDNYSWTGSSSSLSQRSESQAKTIDIRIGLENWFFEHKLALRAGGIKTIHNMSLSRYENTATSEIYEQGASVNTTNDSFNAGLEWVINNSLSFEYGIVSKSIISHVGSIKFTF